MRFLEVIKSSSADMVVVLMPVPWVQYIVGGPCRWSYNGLNDSLAEGLITEADLDTTVTRVLTHKFANGLFDQGVYRG